MRSKITSSHLDRHAYVYVRQSTGAQVHGNVESKLRQYALEEHAQALGWSPELVEVVDEDQGKSGASTEGRTGFARLAHDVAHGKVGAIFAVEASRLARSSQDWQRLLSLCAVAQVALIDEHTVYDPSQHDDKLLLDLKGAMSEQELHWLSLRLAGGRLNKARRGESYIHPPAGYIWSGHGLVLDPDEAVRNAVALVFERFCVEPSARAVQRWALRTDFLMPTRQGGSGELLWRPLGNVRLNEMLHSPIYAGVYVYGRRPARRVLVDGEIRKVCTRLDDPSEWPVRIDDAHPAYISWERYMSNQEKLRENRSSAGGAVRGAPREGAALLAGLLVCGRCGRRMNPRYETRTNGDPWWYYACCGDSSKGNTLCWSIAGPTLDRAVEKVFLDMMVPSELELSLAVERETDRQAETLARAWRARIEQAQYEARLAERRYKAVDPDNRVVARTLEGEWEQRLRDLQKVEQQYDEARRQHLAELTAQDRERIRQLARDLPAVWRSSTTQVADRKAMLRLVIEVIAVHPVDVPKRSTRLRVQWHSGAVSELQIARPGKGESHRHAPVVVQRIRQLAAGGFHDEDIAGQLNEEGLRSGTGLTWDCERVRMLRSKRRIERLAPDRPRMAPLPQSRPDGRYSVPGAAAHFGVSRGIVYRWIKQGLVPACRGDFGTHRDVYWIDIDEETVERLKARGHKPSKEQKQ